jgi:hypothetical protein
MTPKPAVLRDYVLSNICMKEEIVDLVALKFRRQNLFEFFGLQCAAMGIYFQTAI